MDEFIGLDVMSDQAAGVSAGDLVSICRLIASSEHVARSITAAFRPPLGCAGILTLDIHTKWEERLLRRIRWLTLVQHARATNV
jgi:hypothetical protein